MSRECSWKRTEEVQIDLLDLLHRLRRQWKRVTACALAFAVLAGAGSYVLSKNDTMEDAPEEQQEEAAAEPEPVPLTQEERVQGVEAAVRLAQETEELEEYVNDSVLMKIDPYHKNSVQMTFRLEGVTGWTMQNIVEKYLSFLTCDAAVEAIQKADAELAGMEKCYLSELFWASQKTSGTYLDAEGSTLSGVLLSIEAAGMDAGMAADLAAAIQTVMEDYHTTVEKECGSHVLALLSSQEKERADSTLLAQQQEKRTLLESNRVNLKSKVDAFDDEQKAMYAAAESESMGVGLDPEKQAGSGTQEELESEKQAGSSAQADPESEEQAGSDAQAGLASDGQEEAGMTADAAVPKEAEGSVSVLYVLLGFLGGMLAYSTAYSCWYLMHDTVKSVGEFQSYYTFPFYGSIALPDRKEKGGAGRDACERGCGQVLNRVRLSCRKQEVSRLFLAADFSPDEEERACIEGMLSRLREWGLDAAFAENITGNTAVWDMLVETGTVLMLCRLGSTTHRMVDDAMEFYMESGVLVLGAAALE